MKHLKYQHLQIDLIKDRLSAALHPTPADQEDFSERRSARQTHDFRFTTRLRSHATALNWAMEIIKSIRSRFLTYKDLGERAMGQLSDVQFLHPAPDGQNSIPVIVRHMHGNMLSRFTNFLTEDGEKSWRQRDAEFEASELTRDELMADWNAGWHCLLSTLDAMTDTQLDTPVRIRGEVMTALDAILRQLAHYSYHVGQIVTLAKQAASNWTSLSIPKGGSGQYNAEMLKRG